MNELPQPLTPADCDLRGLPFMPLEVIRLLQSTTFALSTGDEFKAAFALWCASWLEVPAASLPDDDRMLEYLSKAKAWKKVRAVAMRGWIACADGRLYHPVVAKNALEAWDRRVDYREVEDNKNERQRRWRERCKQLSGRLREMGITPPKGASLEVLESLLRDAGVDIEASTKSSHVDDVDALHASTVDEVEIGKTVKRQLSKEIHTAADASSKYSMRQDLLDRGVPEQIVVDWLECRKKKKLANTLTALEGVIAESEKAGLSLSEALTKCCKEGWGGFKASWLNGEAAGMDKPWDMP